jgi:hypothetical protein
MAWHPLVKRLPVATRLKVQARKDVRRQKRLEIVSRRAAIVQTAGKKERSTSRWGEHPIA